MRLPFPCHHCGQPARYAPVAGHPYRHVATGLPSCPPATRATPSPDRQEPAGA
jgi:hypothetical protein